MAGVPPDAFTAKGQLWGNPIYDWPALRSRRYRWWVERLRRTFDHFDLARIDHFRGFAPTGRCPPARATPRAAAGRAARGAPSSTRRTPSWGACPLIAEDLGVITPAVTRLRESLGLPGMVVLQFGFNADELDSVHRPERYRAGQVLYTGTHDNDTLRGWYESLPPESVELVRAAGRARARAVVGAHGARALVEATAVHAPGPGRARARVGGADEHARGGGWAVELAPARPVS